MHMLCLNTGRYHLNSSLSQISYPATSACRVVLISLIYHRKKPITKQPFNITFMFDLRINIFLVGIIHYFINRCTLSKIGLSIFQQFGPIIFSSVLSLHYFLLLLIKVVSTKSAFSKAPTVPLFSVLPVKFSALWLQGEIYFWRETSSRIRARHRCVQQCRMLEQVLVHMF